VVAKLLSALADYTAEHFTHEEALQRATHYPDLLNHIKIHKGFIDKLASLQSDLAEGKSSVSMQLMDFLKKWLAHHIGQEDQKVAAHARSRGAVLV
jgi:hemerythrin